MKQLTILVDIDSVVADTLPAWLLRIYQNTGVLATMDQITEWNMTACSPLNQLAPEQIYDILNEPGFTLNLPQLPGANENLRRLHNAGHQIYFVTARFGAVNMPETLAWIRKHFPWVKPEQQLNFIKNKHLFLGDVLIDDSADNLLAYRESHPTADLITIDYPYNRVEIEGLYRVPYGDDTWTKIREFVESLARVENENLH